MALILKKFTTINTFHTSKKKLDSTAIKILRNVSFSSTRTSFNDDIIKIIGEEDSLYQRLTRKIFNVPIGHKCLIVQPRVVNSAENEGDATQCMKEAESLVKNLPSVQVHDKINVPLNGVWKETFFGTGMMEKLKKRIQADSKEISVIFVNTDALEKNQHEALEKQFGRPILDRYSLVLHILRQQATSNHAKLQVALAEIPYLRGVMMKHNNTLRITSNLEVKQLVLQEWEEKIKEAISKLQFQRLHFQEQRKKFDFPIISVVGYINSGKSSLIKALTEKGGNLQPKENFFATMDAPMYPGRLPSKLLVLYLKTVGFISNVPQGLTECYLSTLEDATFGDIIINVENLADPYHIHQRNNTIKTLEKLGKKVRIKDLSKRVITVGCKRDQIPNGDSSTRGSKISVKTGEGMDEFIAALDEAVLKNKGFIAKTVKVKYGSPEMGWLYKNAKVTGMAVDEQNSQYNNLNLIISPTKFKLFQSLSRN